MFAAAQNTTTTADLEPAISIDFSSRLATNINELQSLLGITELIPMNAGSAIKIYKCTKVNTPDQVAEGEVIPLTKIQQKIEKTIELTLNKFRKSTTAEAIQRSGQALAINQTDAKLLSGIQADIKKSFYDVISAGTGKAEGTNLQSTLSATWGAIKKYYADMDATPIYFVSSDDVADYLGTATVTTQTAFGMTYIENFLGLGTVVVAPNLTKGKLIGTAKENLNGAYVPANAGDVANSFNLSADASGLVGMTHTVGADTATIDTLAFSGVKFFPEFADGVIVGSIKPATADVSTGEKK